MRHEAIERLFLEDDLRMMDFPELININISLKKGKSEQKIEEDL